MDAPLINAPGLTVTRVIKPAIVNAISAPARIFLLASFFAALLQKIAACSAVRRDRGASAPPRSSSRWGTFFNPGYCPFNEDRYSVENFCWV